MLHRMVIVLVSLAFVSTAFAADADKKEHQKGQEAMHQKGAQGSIKASTIIDQSVRNRQDQEIGQITDLVLDVEEGKVRYAILSFGGFLGMGERYLAVPYEQLQHQGTGVDRAIILDVQEAQLRNAPSFEKDQLDRAEQQTEQWSKEVDQFWEKNKPQTLQTPQTPQQ